MIRYTLTCHKDHVFEAWFSGSQAFDEQNARGLVTCAVCGSAKVEKAIMAPSVKRSDQGRSSASLPEDPSSPASQASQASGSVAATAAAPVAANVSVQIPPEVKQALREIRKAVVENADYVGPDFAEEARRIHYGEAPARGIFGEASKDDTKALEDEGIEVHPLPVLPEDQN